MRWPALLTRIATRLGFREDTYLLGLAMLVGAVTAAAAVGFHELIQYVRALVYDGPGQHLYGRWMVLLVLIPAAGGLVVGLLGHYVFAAQEGHGIIDVIESVMRSRGTIRPATAAEKIVTSAVTIGSGGSAGAEGPIVQIGAAIASGVGQLFGVARRHMPLLIGCGSAAGISAIFNAPIGGVLFTLEVILQDFSIRTFTPLVLASVIANITTKGILRAVSHGHETYGAIFAMPAGQVGAQTELAWRYLPNFLLLGLLCGAAGAALTRLSHISEEWFSHSRVPRQLRPAAGGAMLGLLGVGYVMIFGWWMLGTSKPIAFSNYPMPAFFGEGYGVIKTLITTGGGMWDLGTPGKLLVLLAGLCVLKVIGTCMTLSSGGSGGIIAPSLFLGATAGGFLGLGLRQAGMQVEPGLYALVGMGAVLAAVVHAPLASILILLELTQDYKLILPAMVATVVATGCARLMITDSIYTLGLRQRGVQLGRSRDMMVLRRLDLANLRLDPVVTVRPSDPLQRVLDLMAQTGSAALVVEGDDGSYRGLVAAEDIQQAILQREAVPLLLVADVMRSDVPLLSASDDLADALEVFSRYDVSYLPVANGASAGHAAGLVSRLGLMRVYTESLRQV